MALKFELPPLPYALDALEPVVSADIMNLHYNKHHKAYVDNLNKALEQYAEAELKQDISAMVALQKAIRFNGGGHVNHSLFWTNLAPIAQGGGTPPEGPLAKSIEHTFGSFASFMEQFSTSATQLQGSGWTWLGYNKTSKHLEIVNCDNQDPLSTTGRVPLLGLDVWEHAYYLQYKNVRLDYIKAIWQIINWKTVAERFAKATS